MLRFFVLAVVLLGAIACCSAQTPLLPQICAGQNNTNAGLYPYNVFDLPNQGSGAFAFSQVGTTSRGFDKRIVFAAGRQGIYTNGSYPPLVRDTSKILGWDITARVRLSYENIRDMVECTGANFSTDVLYARSEFSVFGINERPSGVVRDINTGTHIAMRTLSAQVLANLDSWESPYVRVAVKDLLPAFKNQGLNEWRSIINNLRRAYIPQPRLLDPRTLVAVDWLVNMDVFECTMVWEAPRCAATCKDNQLALGN